MGFSPHEGGAFKGKFDPENTALSGAEQNQADLIINSGKEFPEVKRVDNRFGTADTDSPDEVVEGEVPHLP